jgi:hypothetical protein
MRAINKMMSGIGGGLAIATLALTLLAAMAAGPGTATSNLTTVSTGYVSDSTGSAEAQSNAEFTVAPGPLTLNAVPNIQLGSIGVKSIATGSSSLPLVTGSTTGGTGYDGNGTDSLNVTDYRGNHAGWALTVGMGPFTTTSKDTVTSASLALNATAGAMDNTTTAAPISLTLPQSTTTSGWVTSPETFWLADANSGEGSNSATLASTSALTIGKEPTITAGAYTATMYWALQDAPATTTPAS